MAFILFALTLAADAKEKNLENFEEKADDTIAAISDTPLYFREKINVKEVSEVESQFDLSYQTSFSVLDQSDLISVHASYHWKIDLFPRESAVSFFVRGYFLHSPFKNLSDSEENLGLSDAELKASNFKAYGGALGMSIISTWIQELIGDDYLYSKLNAGFDYTFASEDQQNLSYRGAGLFTEFGLYWRVDRGLSLGPVFAFYIKRLSKTSSEASTTVSYATLGLGINTTY